MNKKLKPAANQALEVCSYESPAISVVEVLSEGVLCASGQIEKWNDGDTFTWDE